MSLDFQSIILKLQLYWQEQGCLIWQPYHTEVGAGTMNPATFLRSLGPEPWNVAYVEPSIRPDDGRYGQNPNRFYQHTQYQVIIKPDRGNAQELYLGSLETIGIDQKVHDIRFVEDNWAQPAISAWGLGWEVWMDGLEITQFTYFQQVGGLPLDPVAVEYTYGLERIAMALQGVRDFKDIRWNDAMTYGDMYLQNEQESSKFAFELANIERMRQIFDIYEAEAHTCLDNHQVIPAHDCLLKCNHTFNILDTRGAIGVTERAGYFRRMRAMARGVAQAYVDQRQRMEYPWLDDDAATVNQTQLEITRESPKHKDFPQTPAPFLVEIGTEELPPGDLEDAMTFLSEEMPALLQSLRLDHDPIEIKGTPRRLVIYVPSLSPRQPDMEEIVKGPPVNRAFDSSGSPTQAAEGFARSKKMLVSDLVVRKIDGGEYLVAVLRSKGRPAHELLVESLPELIGSIQFKKSMRWNWSNVPFSRPIRWLLALYDSTVIPFHFAGLQAGWISRGLRFNDPLEIEITDTADYFDKLYTQGIILDPDIRKSRVEEQVRQAALSVDGEIIRDPALLLEVTHLVEAPSAILGEFNPKYLELPHEVLIGVMKKHQRYFPVHKNGKLLPYFVVVANKPQGLSLDAIKQGNEDVVRARFADAAYFIREDVKTPLEGFVPHLAQLVFQADLGSMLDKTNRILHLVKVLSPVVGLRDEEVAVASRAAFLCKADLATKMVVEMTSLQGIIGREYALTSGEDKDVAAAIYEHYLPQSADDPKPKSKSGLLIGLADRLDSLSGLFAAGLAPTGNKDPFAQRRSALGLVGNLIEWEMDFDVQSALKVAAANLPLPGSPDSLADCDAFIRERLRHMLLDQGFRYDIVDAGITSQGNNPSKAANAVSALANWVNRPNWDKILQAYARCVRITRSVDDVQKMVVNPNLFQQDAEKDLYQALVSVEGSLGTTTSVDDLLEAFYPMIPTINAFFDDVLVMVDDQDLRENRLGLLHRITILTEGVVDLSKLEGF